MNVIHTPPPIGARVRSSRGDGDHYAPGATGTVLARNASGSCVLVQFDDPITRHPNPSMHPDEWWAVSFDLEVLP